MCFINTPETTLLSGKCDRGRKYSTKLNECLCVIILFIFSVELFNIQYDKNVLLNQKCIIKIFILGCINEKESQGRSYYQEDIKISDCFFLRFVEYSGNGGIICVSGESFSMNVSFTLFFNCLCSLDGGAIWFSSTNSDIKMSCANRCSSSRGMFAYFNSSKNNSIEYLSVSLCSYSSSGRYPIWIELGNQKTTNTNSSMNKAYRGSGFLFKSPSSFSCSHCSFSNNIVSNSVCINFQKHTGTMLFINIINNNSPYEYGIIHFSSVSTKMHYCIFVDNQNTLFSVYYGTNQISHSFISHSGKFSISTPISTTNNNSFTKSETYQIHFFSPIYCYEGIPIVEHTMAIITMQPFSICYALAIILAPL